MLDFRAGVISATLGWRRRDYDLGCEVYSGRQGIEARRWKGRVGSWHRAKRAAYRTSKLRVMKEVTSRGNFFAARGSRRVGSCRWLVNDEYQHNCGGKQESHGRLPHFFG